MTINAPQESISDALIEDPPGNSAVEIAARAGFGPLSAIGRQIWHGDSRPCVSCGQLARRNAATCPSCGESLTPDMLKKMQAHAGPWYVLEHVRPFPGVTFERLLRQIKRGVLTPSTIVRGPTTNHQWRYAAETPGLSKHLGLCWNCQTNVGSGEGTCLACGANLGELTDDATPASTWQSHTMFPQPSPNATTQSMPAIDSPQLQALRSAVVEPPPAAEEMAPTPDRVGSFKVSWIVIAILIITTATLVAVVQFRNASL